MSGWDGIPLPPYLRELTPPPIRLDNDANVSCFRNGAASGTASTTCFHQGLDRFGAGIVAGGVLQRGALGAAGEFGHTKIPAAAGVACRCGDTGCVEGIAGGWALVRAMQQRGHSVGHVRDLVDLALRRPRSPAADPGSGRHIGEVLAGAVNLLNPEALVIAGDMSKAYDILVAGLREPCTAMHRPGYPRTPDLPSTHGDQSGVIGSATMILNDVLSARAVDAAL